MDYIDELHRLFQNRRPYSKSRCYTYRTSEVLHLHFRSLGCSYARCICCDYGCGKNPLSKAEIDLVIQKELQNQSEKPRSLLIGSLGSLLDPSELDQDLLAYLLSRVSKLGIQDITIESSWWSLNPEVISLVTNALPNVCVTFECGVESADEAVRSICYEKQLSTQHVLDTVQNVHDAGAQICANIMLGAPFLSKTERMQDAVDSVLWALQTASVDDAVLFPVNIRPYTALRALYELALYEPTNLWEVAEVLLQLPEWALARTHVAWWGNRTTEYSLGNIPPTACKSCASIILDALSRYSHASFIGRKQMAEQRRAILERLLESSVSECSCRRPYVNVGMPTRIELERRRREVCKKAKQGGEAHLVWVSPRESDLNVAGGMFVGSSTVYGANKHGNRSYSSNTGWRENHNDVTQQQISCMAHDQLEFVRNDASVRFMSYNPYYTHGGNPEVLNRAICLNDYSVLSLLADKRSFRRFAKNHVPVPDFSIVKRIDCTPQLLASLYPEGAVVQRGISSGGEGTFVVLAGHELPSALDDPNEELLVSRHYAQNVPINIHVIIYEKDIVLFPASTQLIQERNGKLLYCGCDYVSFCDLSTGIRSEFACQTRKLCAHIQKMGYRGVLGLDAMVADGKVLFLEMNARFQASSHALNRALMDSGLPLLHKLHRESFLCAAPSVDAARFGSIEVPYSTFAYSSYGMRELDAPFEHLYRAAQADKDITVFDDGLDLSQPRKPGAYLFGLLVKSRVSAIFFDRHLNIDQNVSCWGVSAPPVAITDDASWIKLKIALLNQGCSISMRAKNAMRVVGGVREGVNDAIDLELLGHVVNVPIAMPHQGLSPFLLDANRDGQLELYSYGKHLARVTVSYRDQVQNRLTPSGVPVDRICFLATDRVRVQHHDCCDVIERGKRCKFCNFPAGKAGFDLADIDHAVAAYLDSCVPFRHFLIGGGSDLGANALEHTLAVVESIRSRCDKPIYLMDMPPLKNDALKRLKESGVTEVAFNIEVFDRAIAREVMPLKGALPLERYMEALEAAVDLWGNTGAVRSALVVGIEPLSSTLQGVEMLASKGVAPILSVFRPVAGSPMADSVGPDNTWLLKLYEQASAICAAHGLRLGPQCEACRNNVLAP